MIKKRFFIVSVLGLALLASCGKHNAEVHDADEHHVGVHDKNSAGGHDGHGSEIELPVEQAEAAGVVAEIVKPGDFCSIVKASGSIVPASGDETTVVATMSGVVKLTRTIAEGMHVGSGLTLFRISSERLQDGDPSDRAFVAYETAKKEYERAKSLVEDNIVSQKDFNAIRENYEMARIAYQAVATNKDGKGVTVSAQRDGFVTSCLVKDGDYVSMGQPMLTMARNRRMSLVADVPMRYSDKLSELKLAKFRPSYGGKIYNTDELGGKLVAFGRMSATVSSFVPVTFEFNMQPSLMPGMSVEVWLMSGVRHNVMSLPVAALTEEQGVKFVYIKLGDTHYEKREVTTGESDGERVEIKSGLKSGEHVVTKGAIHVKLASASNAIPAHSHSH